jgi:hypothetical protein
VPAATFEKIPLGGLTALPPMQEMVPSVFSPQMLPLFDATLEKFPPGGGGTQELSGLLSQQSMRPFAVTAHISMSPEET